MVSGVTGLGATEGNGRVELLFIWLTACPVVVGPSGTIMAPPSRQPAVPRTTRRHHVARCVFMPISLGARSVPRNAQASGPVSKR
jgi:hypothetical protein